MLVYTHGGAYALFSASSTLSGSVPAANDTGLRVVSVDYTVAPHAKWDKTTDQAIAVIQALVREGHSLKEIAIYGDSARRCARPQRFPSRTLSLRWEGPRAVAAIRYVTAAWGTEVSKRRSLACRNADRL